MADVGVLTSCLCFVASVCTLVLGAIYVMLKLDGMHLRFDSCGWMQDDCNKNWREFFSFRPNVLFDVWTPLLVGILGTSVHVNGLKVCFLFEWLLPRTYVHYAFFMLVTAFFANFGYCGQVGVLIGVFSLCSAAMCVLAHLMREGSIKVLQTRC
mmetsp:Transcript_79102/g.228750  ORF Transcript_79102/g.228750 Transcript_79102/m.228750 type:complete len:154 (+) Transcript_79102:67-528(+)